MLRDPKLLVLLLAGSLTTMTGGVIAPVLPEIIEHLQLDTGLAANLVSVHNLTIALFSPPLGILADRVGRIKVLVPALIFYALFGVAGAFMHDFWSLLVLRALLGAASGGIAAASLGLLGSMYEGQARSQALGWATSTLTITGITDPLLGGWAGANRWQNAFYLYGVGLPIAFLAAAVLQEKPRKTKSHQVSQTKLHQVLLQQHTLKVLIALSLTSVAMYAVVIYAPLYLNATINADTLLNGIVLASRAIGAGVISAFGASKLARRLGSSRAIACGFGLMAVTLAVIPLLNQVSWIVVSAILFGVGFGIVLPNLYNALANLAPEQLRASVLAIGTGMGFLGQFLSPILLAPVLNFAGLEAVFYAAAAIAIATGMVLLVFRTSGESF